MKKQHNKEYMGNREPAMRMEPTKSYYDVPRVARSPSYQQPLEEAAEQTREALRQRTVQDE